jgi:hypothetical protein
MDWLELHPKVKALAYAVAALVLASVPGVLTDTVSLKDAAIADVTAIIALIIPYLKSSDGSTV